MTRPQLGMAPEELLAIAGQLEGCGSDLARVRAMIARSMDTAAGVWQGPDVDQFRRRWEGDLSRRLVGTQTEIEELGRVLRSNVEAQIQASGELGGPGGGAYIPGAPPAAAGGAYIDGAPPATAGGPGPDGTVGAGAPRTPGEVMAESKEILDSRIGPTEFEVRDAAKLIPGAKGVVDAKDLLDVLADPDATGAVKFLSATEYGGDLVSNIPGIGGIAGTGVQAWSIAGLAAQETDFSADTFNTTRAYLAEDPVRAVGVVATETGKAVIDVGKKILPFGEKLDLVEKGAKSVMNLFSR